MIKTVEYLEALAKVKEYESKMNEDLIHKYTCALCKKNEIKPISSDLTKPLEQERGMWTDGVVEKISFGYGSRHDMESFYIAICDDCIGELVDDELAINIRQIRSKVNFYKRD